MRRALCALLLLACAPVGMPSSPVVAGWEREVQLRPAAFTGAPGDSLRLGFYWSKAQRAEGYRVTVTADGPGWTGLPTGLVTTALRVDFTAVNLAWGDSVRFTGCVAGTMAGKPDAAPKCATLLVRHGPTSPDSAGFDPSLIVAEFLQLPHTRTRADSVVTLVNVPVKLCPYFVSGDGKVRLVDGYNGAYCRQMYLDSIPDSLRLPGFPVQMEARARDHNWGGLRLATRPPRAQLARETFARAIR